MPYLRHFELDWQQTGMVSPWFLERRMREGEREAEKGRERADAVARGLCGSVLPYRGPLIEREWGREATGRHGWWWRGCSSAIGWPLWPPSYGQYAS